MKPTKLFLYLPALIGVALTTNLHAQTTAFTYQGFFADNGEPFSAPVEFQFSLWDAASAGSPTVGLPRGMTGV